MTESELRFTTDPSGSLTDWQRWVLQYLRELGLDHETTLLALLNLAHQRQQAGDALAAMIDVELAAARCELVLGVGHPVTLAAQAQRANLLGVNGDRPAAVAALERLLPELVHYMGPDHVLTVTARYYLATYRDWTDLALAAARAYEALLADYRRVLGADHPAVAVIAAELARWRSKADDDAALYRDLNRDFAASDLGLDEDELDEDELLDAQEGAEEFISERAHLVETVDEWLAVAADKSRELGPDHDEVLAARRCLAVARLDAGDVVGGLAEFDALVAVYTRLFGAPSPRTRALVDERELRRRGVISPITPQA
jgi:hypothetical protein